MSRLILASTSIHRQQLLGRLQLPFSVIPPEVDESALADESPRALATRLAAEKADAVAGDDSVVIGSDQVASLDGEILRKPGTAERALEQLVRCQGQSVDFHTAVTVTGGPGGRRVSTVDLTRVHFRDLDRRALARYVEVENPTDCAGGFKAEALGIVLFSRIESSDPTALIGLPLIWLADTLRGFGFDALANAQSG